MTNSHDGEQAPLLGKIAAGGKASAPSSGASSAQPANTTTSGSDNDNLRKFRAAIGINLVSPGHTTPGSLESAPSGTRGVYKELITQQRRLRMQYIFMDSLVYLCHGLQIVIGATLTALGPTGQHHTFAITLLGAINTGVAGILALMKGQGLPERWRKNAGELAKVQDFVEETEALLVMDGGRRSEEEVEGLVKEVFERYEAAKYTAESNRPENYTVPTSQQKGKQNVADANDGANGNHSS